jgi:hypothetical protein
LARLKHLLKVVIDANDAIAKEPSVSPADRLKSESIKLEALAILQNGVIASTSSSDWRSALEKIVEKSSGRQR